MQKLAKNKNEGDLINWTLYRNLQKILNHNLTSDVKIIVN